MSPFALAGPAMPDGTNALHDGRDEAVATQLQRIIAGANAAEQVDDSPSVTTIYRRPAGRSAAPLSPSRSA